MRSALAATGALRSLGIDVRAGVHTGECEVRGDRLGGAAVDIVAAIAARARSGQVLVSRTVTELVVGSSLTFTDCGDHQLDGLDLTWPLFAADGPDAASS